MTAKCIGLATMLCLGVIGAQATEINGSTTGLASPAQTITFNEIPLAVNSLVTTQYSSLGVTFSPGLYFTPQTGYGNVQGNDVGNFTFNTEPSFLNPVTLTFSSTQTGVAFAAAGDATPYLLQAYLNNTLVDSFVATFPGGQTDLNDYFGFSGESFNKLVITQNGDGGGPYYVLDNIELSSAAATPEPSSFALLATTLVAAAAVLGRRRSSHQLR